MQTTTFTFDGTTCTITGSMVHGRTKQGYDVRIVEGNDFDRSIGMAIDMTLETVDGEDLYRNFKHNTDRMNRPCQWTKDRVAFVATIAARKIAEHEMNLVASASAWYFPG